MRAPARPDEREGRIRARARAVARAVRHAPDRLLHPLRRRRAQALVRASRPVERLVILCHGNICRSPYAEAALRRKLAEATGGPASADPTSGELTSGELASGVRRPEVVSAGFIGPDRPSPTEALAVAARRGLDLSAHRSRLLRPGELSEVDLVVVMDLPQRSRVRAALGDGGPPAVLLGDLDPEPIEVRRILDPVERPEEVFERVYSRIDRCLEELSRALLDRPQSKRPR